MLPQLDTVNGKPKVFVFTILIFGFGILYVCSCGRGCLQIKVNYDSVSSLLKAKGEEALEKADQDFQGSLAVSASSSSIHSRHAQMRVLLASFICSVSPLSVPLHLHFFHTYKHVCMSAAEVHMQQS